MASSIGPAASRHATVRPVLLRVISPASDSTSRCFITAGSDIANGAASSLTDRSCSDRRASNARRVGSDSAAKVRSSTTSLNLTMRLSIETKLTKSRTGTRFLSAPENRAGSGQKKRGAPQKKICDTPRQGGRPTTTRSREMPINFRECPRSLVDPCETSAEHQIAHPPR